MTVPNKLHAERASEMAKGADGLQRRAANCAAIALGTTSTIGAARSALADLWQKDVQAAALDIIGQLAARSASDDAPLR